MGGRGLSGGGRGEEREEKEEGVGGWGMVDTGGGVKRRNKGGGAGLGDGRESKTGDRYVPSCTLQREMRFHLAKKTITTPRSSM